MLDPKNDKAHVGLSIALASKGDWDGEIAEYREAIRLKPDFAEAHYNLGIALGYRHNPGEALQKYRTAYELNPQNPDYRQAYDRLLGETRR